MKPAAPHEHNTTLSYEQAGVNYDLIDPLKVAAQRAAAATGVYLVAHGFSEVKASRGESAYVVDVGPFYIASIVECLGSKALVADEMHALTGKSYYDGIAQDTIAMAINDLITVGATPLVVQAYWAAGGSDWFADAQRAEALVAGWKRACDICHVAWGGGETPALAASSPRAASTWPRRAPASSTPRSACRSATSSRPATRSCCSPPAASTPTVRSEEHTSELQ